MSNKVIIKPEHTDKETGIKTYTINPGSTVILEAIPNNGCKFEKWNDKYIKKDFVYSPSRKEKIVEDNMSFNADFKDCEYVVNVEIFNNEPGEVYIEKDDKKEKEIVLKYNEKFTIVAKPGDNYTFDHWYGIDGKEVVNLIANSANGFNTHDNDKKTFTAIFNKLYNIIVIVNQNDLNKGNVRINNGKPASKVEMGNLGRGETVLIEALSNEGYIFKTWNDNSKEQQRTITIDNENRSFIAYFDIKKETIYFRPKIENTGEFYNITDEFNIASPITEINGDVNDTFVIEARPKTGYKFINWIDDENQKEIRKFSIPKGGATYTASFGKLQYRLSIEGYKPGEEGIVNLVVDEKPIASNASNKFDYKSKVFVEAVPETIKNDMSFNDWIITPDGEKDIHFKINPFQFYLTQNVTLRPTFSLNKYKLTFNSNKLEYTTLIVNGSQKDNVIESYFQKDAKVSVEAICDKYEFKGWRINNKQIIKTKEPKIDFIVESNITSNDPLREATALFSNAEPINIKFIKQIQSGQENDKNFIICSSNSTDNEFYLGETATITAKNIFEKRNVNNPNFKEAQLAFKTWRINNKDIFHPVTILPINVNTQTDILCEIDYINDISIDIDYMINDDPYERSEDIMFMIGPNNDEKIGVWDENIITNPDGSITIERLNSGNLIEISTGINHKNESMLMFDHWQKISFDNIVTEILDEKGKPIQNIEIYAEHSIKDRKDKYIAHYKKITFSL